MTTTAGMPGSEHRLGQRYVLQERLAVGGMGEVWRGWDEVLNRPVAVKILRTDLAPDRAFQARFRAEARTAAGLSHGGIAAVFDYGEALGSAFLVMELVPGEPLSSMIAREGALGTDRTLTIVAQASRALHSAHLHGVVHRDVKPANLMITPELRVKVTDFGISRPSDHEPLTATGQVMGTAHYLAPELARGEIASPLSDVYALGVVTYECLAGWRPFEGDNQVAVATAQLQQQPPPLPDTLPLPVRRLVSIAMAKNPADRPQDAKAFATALEDLRLRRLAGTRPIANGSRSTAAPATPATPATPSPALAASRAPAAPSSEPSASAPEPSAPSAPAQTPAPGPTTGPRTSPLDLDAMAGRRPRDRIRGRTGPGRPSRRLTVPLMALIALVAVVGIGAAVTNRDAPGAGTATTRAADQDALGEGPVLVRPDQLIGKPVTNVRKWLQDRDLTPKVRKVPSTHDEGTVLRVAPAGKVNRGSTVAVTVSSGPGKAG